jgi:hypothetical protein
MIQKSCSRCGGPAELSISVHFATLGCSPRRQLMSRTTLLCESCMHGIWARVRGELPCQSQQALREAHAKLAGSSAVEANLSNDISGIPEPIS